MGVLYQRTPGVGIIVRDSGTIQFGLDATRAGLIEVGDAERVARELRSLTEPISREFFIFRLHEAGVGHAAAGLVDELVSFGIWRATRNPEPIYLLGTSILALRLAEALRADNFRVRRPRLGELTPAYLQRLDADVPVLCVDESRAVGELALALRSTPRTWLPVMAFDTRVLLGPFHAQGRGPCPLCFCLHRTDADPRWVAITEQHRQFTSIDPLVAATGVAHAVAAARYLVGRPGLPGATPVRWMAGEMWDIDVFGRAHQQFMEPHARCPVCFNAR